MRDGSSLAEGAGELVLERLDDVLERRALVRLHEDFRLHAGHELEVAETLELLAAAARRGSCSRRYPVCWSLVTSAEIRVTVPLSSGVVRAFEAWTRTIALLADGELVDVLRHDPRLEVEAFVRRARSAWRARPAR